MKTAAYWEKTGGQAVHCYLCPHHCIIPPGKTGRCGVRKNLDGMLYSTNYGVISGIALDPVEKKPLYHFCPGSLVLSAGSRGCNLACGFCQNWASVQGEGLAWELTPAELANLAEESGDRGSCGLAFTYTEPLMWYEYVLETAALVKAKGMKTILVTNGHIEKEPWLELLEHIDAVNIDLKGFTPGFYSKHCGGRLQLVQEAIAQAVGKSHVEITTLLVEGHNTAEDEIRELSAFLADLDKDIPLHLTRYHPAHKWTQAATDAGLIRRLADTARGNLNYVYTGNLPDSWEAETCCPQCGQVLVKRGINTTVTVQRGHCPRCSYPINIQICSKE